jgi:hypothetical protein
MLETRRLSEKTRQYATWGKLHWLPAGLVFFALLFCLSLYVSLSWPQSERHQTQKLKQQQDVQAALEQLTQFLQADRAIDDAMVQAIKIQLVPLLKYRDAQNPKSEINPVRDPQTFTGRINLIVDDLRIIQTAPALISKQGQLSQELSATKVAMVAKKYPEGSAAKAFQWAAQNWLDAYKAFPADASRTWAQLEHDKSLWQHMMTQLGAVELDLKSPDETLRKQATKDVWGLLDASGRLAVLRQTDVMYAQVLLAKDRLTISLKHLPAPPPPEETSARIWQWLVFPGSYAHGLMWLGGALLLTLIAQIFHQLGHRQGMQKLSEDWLAWSARHEMQIRKTSPVLVSLQEALEKMSDGLDALADRLSQAGQAARAQKDEEQSLLSWQGVDKLKQDIFQDVQLTREKLLNVHTQFCSGATRENLIYDMAYIAQALETVESSVQALNRHLDLLNKRSQDDDLLSLQELSDRWAVDVLEFKRQVQGIRKEVEAVDGALDLMVEDVPETLRFDAMPRYDALGRRIDAHQ